MLPARSGQCACAGELSRVLSWFYAWNLEQKPEVS